MGLNKGFDMGTFQDPAVFLATQRASLAQFIAGQVYAVPVEEMRRPTRGRPHVARARQIAIHLARSVFGMSHSQLAAEFGRDRSTIHHACHLIDAMREDSAEFDSTLRWMESLLRRAAGMPE
jgi:chromosomal replication initiation ATPase DnaA